MPLYRALPLVDYSFQFKIATWFWQVVLADEADNFFCLASVLDCEFHHLGENVERERERE